MLHPPCSLTGWYGVDVDGRGSIGSPAASGPTTFTPCKNVSEPSQVIPMSVALRLPSLSMRSCRMMECGLKASCWGRCSTGRSTLFFTSPVRSPMARSRSLLSWSSFSQTVLILSLSRLIRPSSLLIFWTMSSTTPYCISAVESGESGGDSGTGGEGSAAGTLGGKQSPCPPLRH